MTARPLRESRYPDRDRNVEGRAENSRPRDRLGRPLPRDAVDELAGRLVPADVAGSVAEALDHAVRLFDAQRFFEAHEFFEWIWKSGMVAQDDREFWKGVTQVAVGFTHAQRGNASGAVTLLRRACRSMAPYPAQYQGIDAAALCAAARAVTAVVEVSPASTDLAFPTFPRLQA
jgi:hypothetical protein